MDGWSAPKTSQHHAVFIPDAASQEIYQRPSGPTYVPLENPDYVPILCT